MNFYGKYRKMNFYFSAVIILLYVDGGVPKIFGLFYRMYFEVKKIKN